ncbi:MAG: efflux RND transporter periplasmic adaptor subunit, partial [Rikenellaceae bacterium]
MNTKLRLPLALAISIMTASCAEESTTAREVEAKSYKTITISLSDTDVSKEYTASIQGEQYVDIRPQISGVITSILINEGADIKRGQTLFIIDQAPYKAALDVAIANVKSAEVSVATAAINADSSKELLAEDVISKTEYAIAQNTLATAEANLALAIAQEQNARNDLSYTVIKSPVDGVASMIPYRVGALVSSTITDPLVSVSNNDSMHAYFSMSESQILTLTRESGSTQQLMEELHDLTLILTDGKSYDHKGMVDAISGTVDKSTGSVSMRAVFDNPDQMLRNGGNGRVSITTKHKDVIVIPKVATYEIQNKTFVFKVVDGKTVAAEISFLPTDNGSEYI